MLVYLMNANALEEVQGGSQPCFDVGHQEARPAADHPGEVGGRDFDFPEEEGEYRGRVVEAKGENLRAHGEDTAELRRGEAEGGEVIKQGFEVRERRSGGDGGGREEGE